jgi:hypothetical protein
MKLFYSSPTLEEAKVLGSFPFSSDQSETELRHFAPPLSFAQTITGLAKYPRMRRLYPSFWIPGSSARSGFATRTLIWFASTVFPFVAPFLDLGIIKLFPFTAAKLKKIVKVKADKKFRL